MLQIDQVLPSELPIVIKTDRHIPIAVKTFDNPIGAVFYRTGNFRTSLIEIPIDPLSGLLRGIKIVSIDRVGSNVSHHISPVEQGLPRVVKECIPDRILDEKQEVSVSLLDGCLFVDWSNGRQIQSKSIHKKLAFLMGGGGVLGALIDGLAEEELSHIEWHLAEAERCLK